MHRKTMPGELTRALLAVLVSALISTGCLGLDAARDAGDGGGDDEAPTSEPQTAGSPSEPSPTEETVAEPTVYEETATTEEEPVETTTTDRILDPKWYEDSDGNVVPDFIEIAEGYDPNGEDCLQKACPGAAEGVDVRFYTSERNTLLVLDSSGSMAADDGTGTGTTKMEAAKEALSRYAGVSAAVSRTGFMVFGQAGDATEAGRQESCAAPAETLLPVGEADAGSVNGILPSFQPTGWTPIEGALDQAEAAFEGAEGQYNRVILVSDGIETCGGDPVAAARRLNDAGIGLTVDVVGFGVPGDEAGQLRDIAAAGGGEYFDAGTGTELDRYFRDQSEAMDQALEAAGCLLDSANEAKFCDLDLCNAAAIGYIRPEQARYEIASPEYYALEDLYNDIQAGYAKREKAYKETYQKADELTQQLRSMSREYSRAYAAAYGN